MAVTLKELWDSRSFSITAKDSSLTRSWVAYGSADESEVYAEVYATAPVTYYGLVRKSIDQKPQGGGVWRVEVVYGVVDGETAAGVTPGSAVTPGDTDPLGVGFSFDISSSTVHVTQSLLTTRFKAGGGAAPNFKNAIGVTKDKIEGCDVFSGALEVTLTVPRAFVTLQYMRKLKALVGKLNNAPWYGFAGREVLYLGASGEYTGDGFTPKFSVSHKIAVGESETDLDVSPDIVIPTKEPFDYLWVAYVDKDIGGGLVFPVPDAAYVERVYHEGDFLDLEIGG